MITFEEILNQSIEHPIKKEGRAVRFETPELIVSIVGGATGLYGDFDETFEIAIIDKQTKEFVTSFFYPTISDYTDIMSYVSREKMLEIVNEIIK